MPSLRRRGSKKSKKKQDVEEPVVERRPGGHPRPMITREEQLLQLIDVVANLPRPGLHPPPRAQL
jgi:hypothetical protein